MVVVSESAFRTEYDARLPRRAGNGDTLINCLAYIDLNPVRAKMVEKPEQYRWSSIGYHIHQRDNEDNFLSLDFGPSASPQVGTTQMRSAVTSELHGVKLAEFGHNNANERLSFYRHFLYEKGSVSDLDEEREKDFKLTEFNRFRYRTRYFIDSGIIGSREFVDPSARLPSPANRIALNQRLQIEDDLNPAKG